MFKDSILRGITARAARRSAQWMRPAYYRLAYDRSGTTANRLRRGVEQVETRFSLPDGPRSTSFWDQQYESGHWDYLLGLSEFSRNAVIAGYIRILAPKANILDVGCGNGALLDYCADVGFASFTGHDMSHTAIEKLRERGRTNTSFETRDANVPPTNGTWDVIVFNESIFYLSDPPAAFDSYLCLLSDGGIMIVSSHVQSVRAQAMVRIFKKRRPAYDETVTSQGRNSWRVTVFKPAAEDR